MKLRIHFFRRPVMPLSAVVLCLALVSHATPAQTNRTAKSSSAASLKPAALPVETTIPESVFKVPTSPREGRDPFYPRSTRPYLVTVTSLKTNPPAPVLDLPLKGISGTRERPLAIINNQTFAAGEETDLVIGAQRVRIHCIEINAQAGTVLIQIGGERRELHLQQRK